MIKSLYKLLSRLYLKYLPFRIRGFWMYAHPSHLGISQFLWRGDYENYSSKLLLKMVKKGWIFVDVGAHVGYYSLLVSRLIGPSGQIYSFEPDPKTAAILQRNCRFNGYTNIKIEERALSDQDKKGKLYLSKEDPTDHRLIKVKGQKNATVVVRESTLDSYFKDIKVDCIKIDIQGFELKCLKGGKKFFNKNKKLIALIEFWPKGLEEAAEDPLELLRLLRRWGYSIFWIDEYKETKTRVKSLVKLVQIARQQDFVNLLCLKN